MREAVTGEHYTWHLLSFAAVQHERGPRNSTLRRQVAIYFRENGATDLSPMAAAAAAAASTGISPLAMSSSLPPLVRPQPVFNSGATPSPAPPMSMSTLSTCLPSFSTATSSPICATGITSPFYGAQPPPRVRNRKMIRYSGSMQTKFCAFFTHRYSIITIFADILKLFSGQNTGLYTVHFMISS